MRNSIIALRNQRADRGQHPGLLLQRYLCENATGEDGNPEEKRAILQAAINAAVNEEVRALYRTAFDRWCASLPTHSIQADLVTPERDSRLIVGLGSENVLETGIRLHHTYGMPIIPGSALKGLAVHYCDQAWALTDKRFKKPTKLEDEAYRKFIAGKGPKPEDNFHRLLFGSTDDSGCITFHDSWLTPNSPRPLVLDVMTPHHPKWLDGSVPPTDFDSPTPVPFLSVTGTFRVAVSWHGPEHKEAKCWMELAKELLLDALCGPLDPETKKREIALAWGIGGKTTSGYGRMIDREAFQDASSQKILTGEVQDPGKPQPKYKRGDSIQVTREQINDKIRFRADDGFLGHFIAPESPPTGDIPTVWVANVNPQGYTFTMKQPELKTKSSKPDRRGKRR